MTGGDVAPEVRGWLAGLSVWSVVLFVVIIAVLFGAWWRVRKAWRKVTVPLSTAWEDWTGTEDRPGVPGRRGVMAQLQQLSERIDAVLALLADQVTRHEFDELSRRVVATERRLDQITGPPSPTVTTVTVNPPPESETT